MSDSDESDLSDLQPVKRRKPAENSENESDEDIVDEEEAEEDEEEEEEEEEIEEPSRVRDKHKKHRRRKGFSLKDMFNDEAEVDDDDEEADEDYEDVEGDLIGNEDEEALDAMRDVRDLDSRRRIREFMDQDEEEIERYYQQRYDQQDYTDRFGDGEAMADNIAQKERLPGIKDPNLWALKCRIGEEKSTVLALMRKFVAYQYSDTPLQIKSAFAKEGLKGYIYIEAFKQTHVKQAIDGMSALRMAQYNQQLVPIQEMTDVLRVVKGSRQLEKDQWVRLRSGIYKDDLALVEAVEDAQNMVKLKLIPRIDYERSRFDHRTSGEPGEEEARTKRFKRPPQALFSTSKADVERVQREGSDWLFEGNRYDKEGFLHKQFRINAVISEGIRPSLTELERFDQTPDSSQLAALALKAVAASSSAAAASSGGAGETDSLLSGHCFTPGDVVEVCSGDLKNLRGKIVSLESGSRIIVQPNHSDLREPIPFTPGELRKFFNQGDHIKILAGRHSNETGLVIRFEPSLAIILSDTGMNEIKVAPKDIRLWQDRSTSVPDTSAGNVQLMDLVQVDPQTVGVVVGLQRDQLSVLTCFGKIVSIRSNTALRRLNNQRRGAPPPQALDRNGNLIQLKATVRMLQEPHNGVVGEVKHLYRTWAFVYSRTQLENSGLMVAKTRHLAVLNAANGQSPIAAPGVVANNPQQQRFKSNGQGGFGNRRADGREERKLIGKTARIVKGTLKGLLGIICDSTPTHVVLELHSQFKKVPVARENMALLDSGGRIMDTQFATAAMVTTPGAGGATPMREMRTPQPSYGSQTPNAVMATPRPDATPLPTGFNASMATPKVNSMDEPMTPSSSFLWSTTSDMQRLPGSSTHSLSDIE